jgi:hypothetical protein
LINDIEFKRTKAQIDEEKHEKEKCEDDERARKCPKCSKDYIPKDTKFGDCHYHDGIIMDCDKPFEVSYVTSKAAESKMRQVELIKEEEENSTVKTPLPKLVWSCCKQRYVGAHSGCRTSKCGLPEGKEDQIDMENVEEYFKKCFDQNETARTDAENFLKDYKKRPKATPTTAVKSK